MWHKFVHYFQFGSRMSSEVVEPVGINLHTTGNGPQKHQEEDYIRAISQDSQNASESGSWWDEGKNVGVQRGRESCIYICVCVMAPTENRTLKTLDIKRKGSFLFCQGRIVKALAEDKDEVFKLAHLTDLVNSVGNEDRLNIFFLDQCRNC